MMCTCEVWGGALFSNLMCERVIVVTRVLCAMALALALARFLQREFRGAHLNEKRAIDGVGSGEV